MKISRDWVHRVLISCSVRLTCLPGRPVRTSSNLSMMSSMLGVACEQRSRAQHPAPAMSTLSWLVGSCADTLQAVPEILVPAPGCPELFWQARGVSGLPSIHDLAAARWLRTRRWIL